MDIQAKIISALSESMKVDYIRLENDDGITGFVVSPDFKRLSSLDRIDLIDQALIKSTIPLSPQEQRQVFMIAGLSPEEYDVVGTRIRIHRIKELPRGAIKIVLSGNLTDAEYVRSVLNQAGSFKTTAPKPVSDAPGILISITAKSSDPTGLTRDSVIQILKSDRYLEVMAGA